MADPSSPAPLSTPQRMRSSVVRPENRSTCLSREADRGNVAKVGVKRTWNRGRRPSQVWTLAWLRVTGLSVIRCTYQVHIEVLRRLGVDAVPELERQAAGGMGLRRYRTTGVTRGNAMAGPKPAGWRVSPA